MDYKNFKFISDGKWLLVVGYIELLIAFIYTLRHKTNCCTIIKVFSENYWVAYIDKYCLLA